jgi:hypothetical protein
MKNTDISSVDYYCMSRAESRDALSLFQGKDVSTKDVRELWQALETG